MDDAPILPTGEPPEREPTPPAPPVPLRELLLRPLWTESEAYRDWRRCRLRVTLPPAGLAGLIWGALSAGEMGVANPLVWAVVTALAFMLAIYLEERLLPAVTEAGRRVGWGAWAGHLWQGGFVALMAFGVVQLLGAPVLPAMGTATLFAGTCTWLLDRIFCGSWDDNLVELVVPVRTGIGLRTDSHSLAATLTARGDYEGAIGTYEASIEADPGDPVPYLRLARLMSTDLGRHRDGIVYLRAALRDAELTEQGTLHAIRLIDEICTIKLGTPSSAAPDLARVADRWPESPAGLWAGDRLERIKNEMPPQGDESVTDGLTS